jgi:hypothetical protein
MVTEMLQTALTIVFDPRDEDTKASVLELLYSLGHIIDHTPHEKYYVKTLGDVTNHERTVTDLDNRDLTATKLNLDNGDWVEVDPCRLFMNALSNAGMTQDQFDAVVDYFDLEHERLVEYGTDLHILELKDEGVNLASGLEWILQAFKVPGYEFS